MRLSKTGWSIFIYSIYLGSSGLMLSFFPSFTLGLLRYHPPPAESWVKVFGFLAFVLASKGMFSAFNDQRNNMQFDVFTRLGFSIFFAVLIAKGEFGPIMYVFALADFIGAVWTQVALSMDRKDDEKRAVSQRSSGASAGKR